MATKQPSLVDISPSGKCRLATWAALANGDTGGPVDWVDFADRCFQVTGTFGANGSVTMQGSNDGTNWSALSDPQGSALTFTSSRIEQALELPRYVRPSVTAGDETTELTVTLCMRKATYV